MPASFIWLMISGSAPSFVTRTSILLKGATLEKKRCPSFPLSMTAITFFALSIKAFLFSASSTSGTLIPNSASIPLAVRKRISY